jgi:hypothetical protein
MYVGVPAVPGTVATTALVPPLANVYVVVRVTLSAAQVTVLAVAVLVEVVEKPSPYVVTMVCVFPLYVVAGVPGTVVTTGFVPPLAYV